MDISRYRDNKSIIEPAVYIPSKSEKPSCYACVIATEARSIISEKVSSKKVCDNFTVYLFFVNCFLVSLRNGSVVRKEIFLRERSASSSVLCTFSIGQCCTSRSQSGRQTW